MPENYYGDEAAAAAPPAAQAPKPAAEEKPDERPTFLVAKSVCPGMKVGDELHSRIVAVHDEEYECSYEEAEAEKPAPDDEAPMAESAGMGAAHGGMASMYS